MRSDLEFFHEQLLENGQIGSGLEVNAYDMGIPFKTDAVGAPHPVIGGPTRADTLPQLRGNMTFRSCGDRALAITVGRFYLKAEGVLSTPLPYVGMFQCSLVSGLYEQARGMPQIVTGFGAAVNFVTGRGTIFAETKHGLVQTNRLNLSARLGFGVEPADQAFRFLKHLAGVHRKKRDATTPEQPT